MRQSARWIVGFVLALAVVGFGAGGAEAQAAFGVQGSWGSDTDFGIGGRVLANVEQVNLEAVGSFDLFFPDDRGDDDVDYWEINGNLFYHIHLRDTNAVIPYVGGGVNIARFELDADSQTEVGLNLAGGARFPTASDITPFAEAKYVIADEFNEQFVIAFGFLFGGGAR